MAWHHIVPKHEWRARFGNFKGFNAFGNMVNLTTEQHGQVHLHYFNEITHIEYDRVAGLAILGQITNEEATRLAQIASGKSTKGRPNLKMMGNKNGVGGKASKGFKHSYLQNMNKSLQTKGRPKRKVICTHCGKIGGNGAMQKWHFDNCKDIHV
jgi:hypothetical protein